MFENGTYKNYIDGEFCFSSTKAVINISSPLDVEMPSITAAGKEDVDRAIEVAKRAQKEWAKCPIGDRAKFMYEFAAKLEDNKEEIAEIMLKEIAKDKKSSISEVERTADFIRFSADTAKSIIGENISSGSFPGFKDNKLSFVEREPLGVVLAISPFNYPVNLSMSKVIPALMMGNSVVLKPATNGAISALMVAKIFDEVGFPKGVLNVITAKGSELGDYLVTHEGIDFINFTGSSKVGADIAKKVSMKPLLMELGGKDAAIVLNDANLDKTIKNIVSGAYSYSGQRCTAVKRILVLEEIADELVDRLKKEVSSLKYGNPLNEDVQIVPLINDKAADFVESLISEAKDKGADIVCGGFRHGRIIEPTLIDNVTEDMKIAWEEPFGPVLPIIRVKSVEEAIRIANKSEYGLQAAVFTESIDNAFNVARKLEVGTVQINNRPERGPDHFPFLGVKASGIGVQGIKYSMEAMSRPKIIVVNL